MQINFVVFDLDGTLISSHETIYLATLHALREVNIVRAIEKDKFMNMIGMHFEDIFREFGFSVPDFEYFIGIYKSIYFDYIDASQIYPGVEKIINKLKTGNIKIGLLTTKAQDQADLILKHFNLHHQFNGVMGRRPGIAHKPSPEPLLKLSSEVGIEMNNTLMVGDSELDIECGKNAGAFTCAVSYGYRNKEELKKSSPDFLIDNISDLEFIIS
ncbi:MAG: HAD family hydrolase [Bacteroidota bacterium]